MIKMLKDWTGTFEVNGVQYDDFTKIPANLQFNAGWSIKLQPKQKSADTTVNKRFTEAPVQETHEVRITVKKYMTQKADPRFDFMAKWNDNNPMPLRTMTGRKVKETRGMVYMELHGDIWAQKISTCMCCGRKLTNPVSQYFGIGPECGGHNYINPFDSDEELKEAVAEYKKKLQAVTWTGWIIKSAITEEAEV